MIKLDKFWRLVNVSEDEKISFVAGMTLLAAVIISLIYYMR